jgi:hypothetical protein
VLLAALPEELTRIDPIKAWGSLAMSLGLLADPCAFRILIPLQLSSASR